MAAQEIIVGECRDVLATLPANSVHCVVTSPPYWGLRDYGVHGDGGIGLEPTFDEFLSNLVAVFREVRRVLRKDGTLWLNMGDGYAGAKGNTRGDGAGGGRERGELLFGSVRTEQRACGLASKQLIGQPWRLAFALQADGWWLRQDIIWSKPSPMPESVQDRCTKAHEYVFLMTKAARYYFDAEGIKEPSQYPDDDRGSRQSFAVYETRARAGRIATINPSTAGRVYPQRNRRSVWTIASQGFAEAHFATFPERLVEPCLLAGTSHKGACAACGAPWERETERKKLKRVRPNDYTKRNGESGTGNYCANSVAGVQTTTIGWQPTCRCGVAEIVPCTTLDPFAGSGTVGVVSRRMGLNHVGIELNPQYADMARRRIANCMNEPAPKVEDAAGQVMLFG